MVINGHIKKDSDIIDMTHIKRNGKIFVQPGPRGQKMGELTLYGLITKGENRLNKG